MQKQTKEDAIALVKQVMGREFSDEQVEIITHLNKPLNGIAGAGSGKTTVSIGKILYLMLHKDVDPTEILSITFSKKASVEIEERYLDAKNKLNRSLGAPIFKTFHALFLSMIKSVPEYRYIQICDYNRFLYDLLKEIETDGVKTNKEILEQYMRVRGVLINYNVSKDGLLSKKDMGLINDLNFDFHNYLKVIRLYNNLKEFNNCLDFDDMQALLLEYLKTSPNAHELIKQFNKSFKHIILDEYQDISPIQIEILDLLMDDVQIRNMVVVGDDDQSIYGFRGSNPEYIIRFLERYKNARRKFISKNYRCKSNILEEVIPMISENKNRVEKDLSAFNDGGTVTYLNTDVQEQFNAMKEQLLIDLENASDITKDVAVLVRFNKDRTLLADKLAEEGVPVDIKDTKYLLQNNKIYLALFETATAIKNDDVNMLRKHITKCFKNISAKVLDKYSTYDSIVTDILNGTLQVSPDEREYVNRIYNSDNAYIVLSNTWMLIKNYYVFMIKKKIVNQKELNSIVRYILELAISSDGTYSVSWQSLLDAEVFKKAYLTDFINDENVFKIYTIHSVKGLEFKKVYIYGLDSDIVSENDMNKYKMLKVSEDNGVFEKNSFYDTNKVTQALSGVDTNVEEERRIFYVACTRAIDELVIAYSGESRFALLNEMKTFREES